MAKSQKYSKEALDKLALEFRATNLFYPDKLGCDIKIGFQCQCGKSLEKTFKSAIAYGLLCNICSKKYNKDKLLETPNIEKKEPIYTLTNFKKILEQDGAILVEKQDIIAEDTVYIPKETQLKYICKCGKESSKSFRSIVQYGGAKCGKCSREGGLEKTKAKNLEEHGVAYSFQREDVKAKSAETILERYGVSNVSKAEVFKEKKKETTQKNYQVNNPFQATEIKEKIKETINEKYGVDNVSQLDSIKSRISNANKILAKNPETIAKRKATCQSKYGIDYYVQSADFKEKSEKTCLERYGETHWLKCKESQQKIRNIYKEKTGFENPFENPEIQEKIKQYFLENDGVSNPSQVGRYKTKRMNTMERLYGKPFVLQVEIFQNALKQALINDYGFDNPSKIDVLINKRINTHIQNWGFTTPLLHPYVAGKAKETLMKNWNVEYPLQNPELLKKCMDSSYRNKEYISPNGLIFNYQGYENLALDELFYDMELLEEDIITDTSKVPRITWIDSIGKQHKYFPDIYIPSKNLIIEVKSPYTFKQHYEINLLKQQYSIKSGYNFEFWIYDKNEEGAIHHNEQKYIV